MKNSVKKFTEIPALNSDTSKKLKYFSGLVNTMQVNPRAESDPN